MPAKRSAPSPRARARKTVTAKPSVPHSGNIAQFTLSNGINVYVYENFNSPAVIVSGYLQAGAYDEPARQSRAGWLCCRLPHARQFTAQL